jgi:hypothetical protein
MIQKIIFSVAVLASMLIPLKLHVLASEPIDPVVVQEVSPKTNKQIVEGLVQKYASIYNVDKGSMLRTLANENPWYIFDKQSELKYKAGNRWGFPAGTREKSYGQCQIHLPDHPDITYEQAIDPEWCINWMAQKFSQGKQGMWMGYKDK